MTTEPTDDPPINDYSSEPSQDQNDLTRIRGIGQVKQQWLQELLNIRTIQALAAASVDDIEAAFTASRIVGRNVLRREIEEWVVQAQTLSTEQSVQLPGDLSAPMPAPTTVSTTQTDRPVSPSASESSPTPKDLMQAPVVNLSDDNSDNNDAWAAIAGFSVTVQTQSVETQVDYRATFHNSITKTTETQSGTNREDVQRWIVEQVGQALPERVPEGSSPTKLRLTIDQIHLFQPPKTSAPIIVDATPGIGDRSRSFPTLIANQPFVLVVSLQLTGTIAAPVADRPLTYRVEARVRDLAKRTMMSLGDPQHGDLDLRQRSYLVQLPEIQLPSGGYRLQVIVTVEGPVATLDHIEMPLLQVL